MSAAIVEAFAAAHRLEAGIAVSMYDVGSNLRALPELTVLPSMRCRQAAVVKRRVTSSQPS
jgi:hypothetical protein